MKIVKSLFTLLAISALILLVFLIMQFFEVAHFRPYISVLFPKGVIALKERNLLLIIQGLMLLVVFPVYLFTFLFSWIYRASNEKAVYDADLVDNTLAEYFWWGVPLVLTAVIGYLTCVKTYELDPFKPIESDRKEKTIQVVALQWKWLFIYPEEKIASLNFLQIPVGTPIHFEITADAPMNSFWIPHLGGQIYAMPKMKSQLYLMADEEGDFRGSSANISGEGFAGMHFITRASSEEEYASWVQKAKNSSTSLDQELYEELALPSKDVMPKQYRLESDDLFEYVLMKYMHPRK